VTEVRVRLLHWFQPAYALLLALFVVAPLLGPGYLLLRDAVSTPRSYLSDTALGLTSAPRATPQDFAVALASQLIDGGIVVKSLLVLGLWLAGWGAARLVATALPSAGLGGQFVAITMAIWNPYVAERLLQGHWSLLVGYGCLPWVAAAMLTMRAGDAARWSGLFGVAFWIALAGLTPTGLMLAAAVALVCVAVPVEGPDRSWPRWLCAAIALAAALVAALPWLTASVLGSSLTSHAAANTLGVNAFAPRAEPGLGTLGSQPRRDLEWRRCTRLADNAFRDIVRHRAAGRGGGRPADGGASSGSAAVAGAGGRVCVDTGGTGHRTRPASAGCGG
jgi:hypothetical protein